VMPTLAEHLGVELPWVQDGQSLADRARQAKPLIVEGSDGNHVLLDDFAEGVAEASAQVGSVFGKDGGGFELYSFGDYDSLIGASPSNVASRASGLSALVDESWRLSHVTPNTGQFVPGFIHGHLTGEVQAGLKVAIALNGAIRTVVPTFALEQDEARFNAILPDDGFVSGFNELEMLAVSGQPGDPVVETIDLTGHTRFGMEVAESGRVTRLVASDGTFWPVAEGSTIVGSVDDAAWSDSALLNSDFDDLEIQGWAVDEGGPVPAEQVVFFVNGVFSGTAGLEITRPDIQRVYEVGDELVSGFLGRIPEFLPAKTLEVRVFALSNGVSEELPVTEAAQAAISAG